MKTQATPSLILERYELTDTHRLQEAEKWLFRLSDRFDINRDKYIRLEVLFRQLFIHPKMNTAFSYQFDEPINFSSNHADLRKTIDSYLARVESKKNYGFHKLDLEKKEKIKSAEVKIKKDLQAIEQIAEFTKKVVAEGSLIPESKLIGHIKLLKKISTAALHKNIHESKSHTLKKFVTIDENGVISVKAKSFDYFITYSLLMTALWEPFFLFRSDSKGQLGLNGFIAQKLLFEFGRRLGFNPTSKDVADKVRDNQQSLKHYKKRLNDLGLSDISKKF